MKKNRIYLIDQFSPHDIDLLKKDLLGNFINIILRIKNLNLSRNIISEVVNNSIEKVFKSYTFNGEKMLGDAVKTQVFEDLRIIYEETYSTAPHTIKWPDLAFMELGTTQRSSAKRRIEMLHSLKILPPNIMELVNKDLTKKQQEFLIFLLKMPLNISYKQISYKIKVCPATVSNNIRIIYFIFNGVIQRLGIRI